MNSILESHYSNFEKNISSFVEKCESKKIKSIKLIQEYKCLESYPCQGHEGVYVEFDNGSNMKFNCDSVTAGIIMYFCGVQKGHCIEYVNTEMKKKLDDLKKTYSKSFCSLIVE